LPAIYRTIREDYSLEALDENLWAFWGFYQAPGDRHCQARLWRKVKLGAIETSQVIDLPVWEMAFMLAVAMELEDPILDYSRQNGEGFRLVLPGPVHG
jgi:hypothetical protein